MNAQYVKLSMIPSGVMPTLYVSQYDVGRPLGLIVTNGTELVDMDSYSVTIEATRSDGTQITAAVTTADNIGTFQTTATMTNVAGIYKAQLVIAIASGKRIASIPFLMNVTAAAMDENGQGIAEDQSLYQQYTGTVQTLIATIRADLNTEIANRQSAVSAEAAARQTADNTLQSNINSEASTRAAADQNLQAQISQIVAPSGEAPSAAEVQNARIGADGTVYPTLGDAIRTQNSDLKSQIETIDESLCSNQTGYSEDSVAGYINILGEPKTSSAYRTMTFAIPEDSVKLTVTGSNKTSGTAKNIAFISFKDSSDNVTVIKTISAGDETVYTETVTIPSNAVKVLISVTYDYITSNQMTVNTFPVLFQIMTDVAESIISIQDKVQNTIIGKITVTLGGYSVTTTKLKDIDSTTRARTNISDVSVYGNEIRVSLPDELRINTFNIYDGSAWSSISAQNAGVYTIPSGYTKFRLSFKNRNNDSTDITDAQLKAILVIPTHQVYVSDIINSLSWFNGKIYAALGDSITYGFIPRNYEGYPGKLQSYAALAADKLGMSFRNYGISGSSLAYISSRDPMCRRYTSLPDTADVITFMGGVNDIRNGIQLGTMSDRDDSTYYGALHVLMGGLYKKYMIDQGVEIGRGKKIIALTPIKLLSSSASELGGTGTLVDFEPWADAVKEVAAYYSIPCLDFYNLSGINPHLNETVQGTETGYTGFYNPYITDGTHPTQEGQEIMSDVFCGFLKTLV